MPELSTADRQRVWRGLMRHWSNLREACAINKADLQAAVNATDTWVDDNQAAYNSALPTAARDNLTAGQKTLLFCLVALARVDPGVLAWLRRMIGEVD